MLMTVYFPLVLRLMMKSSPDKLKKLTSFNVDVSVTHYAKYRHREGKLRVTKMHFILLLWPAREMMKKTHKDQWLLSAHNNSFNDFWLFDRKPHKRKIKIYIQINKVPVRKFRWFNDDHRRLIDITSKILSGLNS